MRSKTIPILLLTLILAGCSSGTKGDLTTSGTIMATEVNVAPEVAGSVKEVLVNEGAKIAQGDPVVRLDTAALDLQVQQAKAALALAEAKLAEAQAGARPDQIRQSDQLAAQARADQEGAQKSYNTIKQLYDQGAATKTQLDAVTTQLDAATAKAKAAQAQADLVRQGSTAEQIKQLEAAVAQAKATADLVQLNQSKTTVKAPISGVVLHRLVEPGALVAPGAAVATLANLDDLWLRVYVPENQLDKVKLGQTVSVMVDAFPKRTFQSEVIQISDKAEYTPRNVQTKEERVSTVYAVKLKLKEGLGGELKPGMPADVTFPAAR
jgi:HlyD family secretion protein